MKKYPSGIREAIVKELKEGRSQRELLKLDTRGKTEAFSLGLSA